MAKKQSVKSAPQYNAEMYMARLLLKNPGIHFCTLIICLYSIARTVLSVAAMIAGGNIIIALLSIAGILTTAAGSVCALIFSRDGGERLITALTASVIGVVLCTAASAAELIFFKADAEVICQTLFTSFAIFGAVSVLSAAKGTSAKTACGYLMGISGLATLLFSAIALISVCSALEGCFASTYNWSFLPEDIDINTTQVKWFFFGSSISGTVIKTVFFSRFIERIAFLAMLITISAASLKMAPYIRKELRTVGFAQEAGDFSAYDGSDFRTISKRRASENVRNQSYYGIGSLSSDENIDEQYRVTEKRYNTNEYGDYLDEESGIFYYYDRATGKYYYLDEKSGEYVYKAENRKNVSVSYADAMPWELSESDTDDEDNIYNY